MFFDAKAKVFDNNYERDYNAEQDCGVLLQLSKESNSSEDSIAEIKKQNKLQQ